MIMKLMQYSVDGNGIGHLVFDNPTEKVNSISKEWPDEFLGVLDRVESDSAIKGLMVQSAKPGVFVAGADIKWFKAIKSSEDALALVQKAHIPFDRLEGLNIPTLAVINGICLGGGLELALACRYRVAIDDRSVQLGLPEVNLGVIPGGGGTQRLPALIGIQNALRLATTGKPVKASEALTLGIVDAVLPADNFLDQSTKFLLSKIMKKETVSRPWLNSDFRYGITADEKKPEVQKAIFAAAREAALKQTKGHIPAPLKVIDAIEAGARDGFMAGLSAEKEIFRNILMSREARGLIDLFIMQSDIRKVYGSKDHSIKPMEIKTVGIVGAGLMGSGIAHSAITSGYKVIMKDVSQEVLDKAVQSIRGIFAKDVEKGKMAAEKMEKIMSLLGTATDYAAFRDADIIIEAVFEDVKVKHAVIKEVEEHIPSHCIFASNTSSIAISELAKASKRPENVVGMHYFSPVNRMPLLEIIKGGKTSDQTMVAAVAFAHKTRKTPMVVNDGYGFYTTRIVASYIHEALECLNDGASIEDIDAAMMEFGMPVGPMTLLDETGHDVGAHVTLIMHNVYPSRFSKDLPQITIKNNRYGRKNQKGFYIYDKGKKLGPDQSAYEIFSGRKSLALAKSDIKQRIMMSIINEVGFCMGENIVTNVNDAEIGLIFSMGFPTFIGGPLHYVDAEGIENTVKTLRKLQEAWGSRFNPAPYWVKAAEEKRSFFR